MDYCIYKFEFQTPVHFGKDSLEKVNFSFDADTLFSALCIEALKNGEENLGELVALAKEGKIKFTDAFPYMNDKFYIPKPFIQIRKDVEGNSNIKKAYKKLQFISTTDITDYLNGDFNVLEADDMDDLGNYDTKVSVSIRGEDETKPYRVGYFCFSKNCGLYIILGYEDEKHREFIEELLVGLSYTGIGGERSSGYGKFLLKKSELKGELLDRLRRNSGTKMLLSCAFPKDGELENALTDASYSLERRGGFVESVSYSDRQMKKQDFYVFKAGSCFKNDFIGDIYDVSGGQGSHPVYKYAKSLFMGVTNE